MRTIALIRADFMKQRHTPYFCIHSVIPVTGAILFVFYFLYYQNVDELKKICFLLELTAMVFPLLYSVCDWGGNEPDRNDPLEVADAICAGISYE